MSRSLTSTTISGESEENAYSKRVFSAVIPLGKPDNGVSGLESRQLQADCRNC